MPDDLAAQSKFQWWARLGFVTRGLLYVVIAVLAIGSGRTEDLTGAMEYLRGGFGAAMMIFLVVGMAGYGLWRLCDGAFGMDTSGDGAKVIAHRVAAAFSGMIYLGLAWKAGELMLGSHLAKDGAQQSARTALHLPAGPLLLFAAAAVLAGAAVVQLYKAISCSFLKRLDGRANAEWMKWLGRLGFAARGIVFAVVAYFLFSAAKHHNAAEAGGLEQALDALRGPPRFGVAAGLLLFGLFSFVEARYRRIHKPPTENIRRELERASS